MKLSKLELHNYRGFETFHASFHDKLTVIVGDNGAGKTSLLDAAAVAIGTFCRVRWRAIPRDCEG